MNRRDFLRKTAVAAIALPRVAPIYVGIPREHFNGSYAEQESEHWCWAASIQMILDYYGVVITQEHIVARSFGLDPRGRLPDFSGSFQVITANLNLESFDLTGRRYQVQAKFGAGAPRPNMLLEELNAQFPMLLCYRNAANRGHVVVATGASYVPSPDGPSVESVVVRDPWPSPENRWSLGRVEHSGLSLASRMTAHWQIRVA
jgi:hypothetical protein